MNFKKILSCAVAAILMCSVFTGCTGGNNNNKSNKSTTSTQQVPEFKAGVRTDKDYTSEWLGIKYTLKDGYVMMTDEQLEQAMKIGADNITANTTAATTATTTGNTAANNTTTASTTGTTAVAKNESAYEMAATKTETGESIMIIAEKMSISLNESQYEQAFKSQLKNTTMNPTYKQTTTRNVAGIDFADVSYSFTQDNLTINQTVLLKSMGNRMVAITLTYKSEDVLNEMLAGFSKR